MKILGIETSCDETALSIVECSGDLANPQFKIIDSIINSQAALHAEFGGVFPTLAKREHQKNLPILLEEILKRNSGTKFDAIAVTSGPGLEPALWVGIEFAKELGKKLNIPVIPTNHMEGHIISPLLHLGEGPGVRFPVLALLISGGHTELVLVNSWGSYEILGATRDDAVGEAFDKVARILGLGYPGGPEISRLATQARSLQLPTTHYPLPRPMIHSKDLEFSFSGLKTAVLYLTKNLTTDNLELTTNQKMQIAREFEDAVTEVIIKKTCNALDQTGAQTLIVGGGVIANTFIREHLQKLADEQGITLLLPSHEASTDNALMIAAAGYLTILQNKTIDNDFRAEGNLKL